VSAARPGIVYLVGAGPGDPGLLTARAIELIASADVIVHDRLIPPGAVHLARPGAEVIPVGKEGGGPSTPQDRINSLLVEHGSAGRFVVRLKGGDPFVFGRGGEEAIVLREAGIDFEVVPGVTSGIAAPAAAGIPVTQRGMSSAIALVTGHEDPAKGETSLDYQGLAAFPGTLALYMGVKRLASIASSLIEAGRPADEPAAVIHRGTMPGQRTVVATLGTIAEEVARAGVTAPAITVIGEVASLHDRIGWRERLPLIGSRIVVTRAKAQAGTLSDRLAALGAEAIEVPAIRIEPIAPGTPLDPRGYELVCLTSANSVELLFERIEAAGLDARALAGSTVAAIGQGTARALAEHGIAADIVPERAVAEGLVAELEGRSFATALLARAEEGRDVIPEALAAMGCETTVEVLYRTVAEPLDEAQVAAVEGATHITFTSASTVRNLIAALGGPDRLARSTARLASIGPITSSELRGHGLEPDLEAERHDIDGMIESLVADCGR